MPGESIIMPWGSIIMFLISFFLSKSKGASTGQAAAIGAAAGLATYYIADPSNPDNLLGFGSAAKTVPGSTANDVGGAAVANGGGMAATLGGVVKTGLSEVGNTVRSWGPAGTLGVVAGTTALASSDTSKWLPWAIGGVCLLLLFK